MGTLRRRAGWLTGAVTVATMALAWGGLPHAGTAAGQHVISGGPAQCGTIDTPQCPAV